MYLILLLSKSPLLYTEVAESARKWQPVASHVDWVSSSRTLIGYFPENQPSVILLDFSGFRADYAEFLLPHLQERYPNAFYLLLEHPSLFLQRTDTMPNHMNALNPDGPHFSEDLSSFFRKNEQYFPITPADKVFSLEKSLAYFEELSDPESAFHLKKKYQNTFPLYQFFTCILSSQQPYQEKDFIAIRQIYSRFLKLTRECVAVYFQPDTILFIFYSYIDELTSFSNLRSQLVHQIWENNRYHWLESRMHLYFGCIHTDLFGMYKSYFEAMETYYIDHLYRPAVCFDEISRLNKQAAKPMRLVELERLIRANMEYKNGDNIIHYIKMWFQECREMNYTLENVQMDLLNLYSSIKYVIFDMFSLYTIRIKNGWEVYEIFRIQSIDELEEWFYTWVNYTLNNLHIKRTLQSMRIQDVLEFIENHLMEDISLESVSSYFFLNPSYFSTMFKKEMNETFTSYVTRQKMQKAAELLHSDRKVWEITHLLGYEDAKHFRKLFKRYFHCTPTQYQTMHKHSDYKDN